MPISVRKSRRLPGSLGLLTLAEEHHRLQVQAVRRRARELLLRQTPGTRRRKTRQRLLSSYVAGTDCPGYGYSGKPGN